MDRITTKQLLEMIDNGIKPQSLYNMYLKKGIKPVGRIDGCFTFQNCYWDREQAVKHLPVDGDGWEKSYSQVKKMNTPAFKLYRGKYTMVYEDVMFRRGEIDMVKILQVVERDPHLELYRCKVRYLYSKKVGYKNIYAGLDIADDQEEIQEAV